MPGRLRKRKEARIAAKRAQIQAYWKKSSSTKRKRALLKAFSYAASLGSSSCWRVQMRAYSTKAYAASHMRKRAQLVAFSKANKPFLAIHTPGKAKLAFDSAGQPPAKKPALAEPGKKPGSHDGSRRPANPTPFRFHSVDVQWQRNACATLGLRFEKPNGVTLGGPDVVLNPPSAANCKAISGDGNCLFRTFSHIICGSEEQHMAVRLAILNHMASECVAPLLLRGHLHGYASIAEYTTAKNMDKDDSWGTDVEMLALAHMLHTTVYAYVSQHGTWLQYDPTSVEAHCNVLPKSMYIRHTVDHFDVVCSV